MRYTLNYVFLSLFLYSCNNYIMKNKSIIMAFKISVLKKKLFEHIVIEQNYYFTLKLERCNENNI